MASEDAPRAPFCGSFAGEGQMITSIRHRSDLPTNILRSAHRLGELSYWKELRLKCVTGLREIVCMDLGTARTECARGVSWIPLPDIGYPSVSGRRPLASSPLNSFPVVTTFSILETSVPTFGRSRLLLSIFGLKRRSLQVDPSSPASSLAFPRTCDIYSLLSVSDRFERTPYSPVAS